MEYRPTENWVNSQGKIRGILLEAETMNVAEKPMQVWLAIAYDKSHWGYGMREVEKWLMTKGLVRK